MKKFLTFLALALIAATGAWAQTSGFKNCSPVLVTEAQEGYFLIDGFAQANKNHHFVYDNGGNFATAENIGTDFDAYVWHVTAAEGGKYNFQNVSTGKYITIDGTQMTLTDTPGAIAFDFSGGFGSLGTGGNTHYDCGNAGTGTTTWNDGVSGSRRMRIYKAETGALEESYLLNLKGQNVKYVNESGKNFKVVSDAVNGNDFVFKFGGNPNDGYTIYSVGASAYLQQNNVDATDNVKAVTTTDASAATHYDIRYDGGAYFFAIHGSNTHVNQRDGYFSTWKGKGWGDVGSKILISKVEPIQVIINNAPAGTKISFKGTEYADGSAIPLFDFTSISDITVPEVTGYTASISKTGKYVVVSYSENVDLSDLYVHSFGDKATSVTPNQWYFLTQTRDLESAVMDNGVGETFSRSDTKLANFDMSVNTPAADIAKYLVRFIPSNVGSSYQMQFGTGHFMAAENNATPANGVAAKSSDKYAYNFLISPAGTNGFDLGSTDDGMTRSGCGMDNSNNTSTPPHALNFWASNAGGNYNTWYIYPVELGEYISAIEYTVNITGAPEGTKITCGGNQYGNGEKITEDIEANPVSAPILNGYFTATVEVKGLDINVTYKKFPFEIADKYAKIKHWYAITVHSNQTHYLYTDDDGGLKFNNEGYEETDAYAWGFVGNNTNGYTIYNKATGSSVALDNKEPAGVSKSGAKLGWLVSTSSETSDKGKNGFTIYLDSNPADNKYLNFNANKGALYHWKNRDAGSTFTPTEIDPVMPVVIGETGYATFYDRVNRAIPENVKAYYCVEGANGYFTPVEITEIDYIPAQLGVILEGNADTYNLAETEDRTLEDLSVLEDIYYNSLLSGYTKNTTVEDAKAALGNHIYVFSKKDDVLGFYTYAGTTLAAHKAFYYTNDVSVNGFILDFNGTEGINSVISATNLKAGYDIQGRRINKMQKGINILGGKKIIK